MSFKAISSILSVPYKTPRLAFYKHVKIFRLTFSFDQVYSI